MSIATNRRGPVDQPVGDRLAHAGIDAHQVPHRRHTVVQSHPQPLDELKVVIGQRMQHPVQRQAARAGQSEVDVAVEEAGADRIARQVDARRSVVSGVGQVLLGAGPGDPALVDQDCGRRYRCRSGSVDEGGVVQQ